MPLTAAQHEAIHNHADNLIVVAGAGSGKTFVLVERYLALLEAHEEWPLNALVAITFTQKAAQEMRERVRQHLQRRAESGLAPWADRLAAMDSARIDTIHGLCAALLRANAAEARVDPGFAVLDEVESAVLLDTATDDVFRAIGRRDPLLELFAEYGETAIRAALKSSDVADLPEHDRFPLWEAQWRADAEDNLWRLLDWCDGSAFIQWPYAVPDGDRLGEVWRACADLLARLRAESELAAQLELLRAFKPAIVLRSGTVAAWGDNDVLRAAKAALGDLRACAEACSEAIDEPPGEPDQRAAALLPLWAALGRRVRRAYRAAKAERAVLDFDDLERLTCDLLQDDRVRERYLGAEFKHVLVDEFQDTNAAQWTIIQRIADPALAGGLFVVGDPKQSIYGFRGADVSVFERVRADLEQIGGRRIDLARSFRTHGVLLGCFNDLFGQLLLRDLNSPVAAYEVDYGAMEAERGSAPGDDPALELLLLDRALLKDSQEDGAARHWEARWIARRIKDLVANEHPVYDKQAQVVRPMGYGDAALLLQAMTHVTTYEAAFKAEGVPYLTTAGKGYFDRQEVWDLLNLLRSLYNPADELALAAALRSPLFSLSDDALLALRLIAGDGGQPIPLWDSVDYPECVPPDEAEAVAFACHTLRDLRQMAGRVPIADLLRAALDRTGALAVLTGLPPDGTRRRENVAKLVSIAESAGRVGLGAFMAYLRDLTENEAREGEALLESENAVQLMTVHKSKGLEFPVVVLADASYDWARSQRDTPLILGECCKVYDDEGAWYKPFAYRRAEKLERLRGDAERRRLFYVAATRAQDQLIVSGQVSFDRNGALRASGWLGWLIGALDLDGAALQETQIVHRRWGDLRVDCPRTVIEAADYDAAAAEWGDLPGDPPALLAEVPRSSGAATRSLTAQQIADLGSAYFAESEESRAFYRQRWQRSTLYDAPGRLDRVQRVTSQHIGEIVHQAIRWPLPDERDEAAMRGLLRRYAWELGIIGQDGESPGVIERAYELLKQVRQSDVFRWVAEAREVHRQLPFVYRTGRRTVHGVIDLLLRTREDRWIVVDFKTSRVPNGMTPEEHARRFHLQVGVYAAAMEEMFGVPPEVRIHYIEYAHTVTIATGDWKNALARLEDYIGELVGYG